jgi:hypothetical protein
MTRFLVPPLLCSIAIPALAAEGEIGTLVAGHYACELPGDATGPVGRRLPDHDFRITNASGYRVRGVRGAYLMTGARIVMTSGPFRGQRYRRQSSHILRAVRADGADAPMRCILARRRPR